MLGGGLLPKGQAILFQSVPKAKQAVAQGMFGIMVLVGPALGPTLGGQISPIHRFKGAYQADGRPTHRFLPQGLSARERAEQGSMADAHALGGGDRGSPRHSSGSTRPTLGRLSKGYPRDALLSLPAAVAPERISNALAGHRQALCRTSRLAALSASRQDRAGCAAMAAPRVAHLGYPWREPRLMRPPAPSGRGSSGPINPAGHQAPDAHSRPGGA
ncbi:MAG: hypothetical protein ACKN89_13905 [Cyanobium sp.]